MILRTIAAVSAILAVGACAARHAATNAQSSPTTVASASAAIEICGKRSHVATDRTNNPAHDRALQACLQGYRVPGDVVLKWPPTGGPPVIELR